jgi:CRP/FNR family transcriptional regulator
VEKPTEAYLIPTALFLKLSNETIAVQAFTNDLMASRFSDVMWIMEQALFSSFDKRLANFLLDQENIEGRDTLKITHERIANDLGTAREVVSRMLKYFQTEGMVDLGRGTIRIRNREKLARLAL